MTLCLAMIVRDEADTVPLVLAQAKPLVDAWAVIDTGSLDDTPAVVVEALAGIPGRLEHARWDGFGKARTLALELAREQHTDYTLMLDADHTIELSGDRPDGADAYLLPVKDGSITFRLPLLTKSSHPFVYRGAAHAYLASDGNPTKQTSDWLTVNGGPGASRQKLEQDVEVLTRAFSEDPSDKRTVFYLARSHDDLDHTEDAIRWYRLRALMGGWGEEVYYARYRLGCLLSQHVAFAQGAPELLAAWQAAPHRAEALRALANAASAVADKTPQPTDGLFVHPAAYGRAA